MVKIFGRVYFPLKVTEILHPLLDNDFIYVVENFDNGTPIKFGITNGGIEHIANNFNEIEITEHIKQLENSDLLFKITSTYIDRKNGVQH